MQNQLTEKKCEICGDSFTTNFSFQKYCSTKCGSTWKTPNGDKMKLTFDIILFDLKNGKRKSIQTSENFLKEAMAYCLENFKVEEVIAFYFEKKGFVVKKAYHKHLERGHSDLIINKDSKETYVEVKSRYDSLKIEQFDFLFNKLRYNDVLVAFAVPKNYLNKVEVIDEVI